MANIKAAVAAKKLSAFEQVQSALTVVSSSDEALTFDISTLVFDKTKTNIEMQFTASDGQQYTCWASYKDGSKWESLFEGTDDPQVLILAPGVRVSDTADSEGNFPIFASGSERKRNWFK